jgi:hypothetical protein
MMGGDRFAEREWTTNWSGVGYGNSHSAQVGQNRGAAVATFKDASGNILNDSLTRASRYRVTTQKSTIPGNWLTNFPLGQARVSTPLPQMPKTPKPTRRRVPKIVLDFKQRCKEVAMSRAGRHGDLHLGLVRLFMENDADG